MGGLGIPNRDTARLTGTNPLFRILNGRLQGPSTNTTNSLNTGIVSVNRRECLTVVSAGIGGTAGCLSPSDGNTRSKSTLVVENQRGGEQEVAIRFEDGDIVLFNETFRLAAGEQRRVEGNLSRGATQVAVFVDVRSSQEAVYEDTVPGGVPEYHVSLRSDGIDVVWAEN